MDLQINVNEADISEALSDYLVKMGVNTNNSPLTFITELPSNVSITVPVNEATPLVNTVSKEEEIVAANIVTTSSEETEPEAEVIDEQPLTEVTKTTGLFSTT